MPIPKTHQQSPLTHYRLGIWYGIYRLVIAFSLLLIFFLTYERIRDSYEYQDLYFFTLVFYCLFGIVQLVTLQLFQTQITRQLILFCAVDILCFTSLNFAIGFPSLHISLLFVITIFMASLLLSQRQCLALTLCSTIAVVYSQFFGTWFKFTDLSNIGNSALLAFLFLVVHFISQLTVQRFRLLEHLNSEQSQELLRLQNINRYILEQIDMGYLVLNEQQEVVLSNPAAQQLLGIPSTFKQLPLQDLHPQFADYLQQIHAQQGERFVFDSSKNSVLIRVQKLKLPQSILTLLIMQDAQRLNQHVQQLKLAALGQLSASIAHEIRNPLASIVQANSLIVEADAEQTNMLHHMIQRQAQRIDHIIHSTLNMAHHQATLPISIHLNDFLPRLIKEDLPLFQAQIKVHLQDEIQLSFDEAQLRQVLINLIQNALRHNAPDREYIEIFAYLQHDLVYIDIIDFGQGVPEQQLSQLFSPFFTTEVKGTGLGLYLSHSFCEANQAKLSYSKLQDGTCFRIECIAIQIQ
ncbi:sensor histidine kinase [Acinetobacter sp. MD2(2019)]|uniref:sensor histidine kinase n=1 Tax=Acinetobacter sp. MD2(2019) TaxID=2605273 RepID=UPI002D1F80A3|nr:ATP-binding protein [Acinetobacter sp. MD2(2019)]MEB3753313.1 PAS domain-containing protein [Acinetobacter sp. MD2(2019)]